MVSITVTISGMMCGMCESHINDVIRRNFSVKKVSSSHSKGLCTIIAEEPIDEEKLMKAIAQTGYSVEAIEQKPYEKKKKGLFSKKI